MWRVVGSDDLYVNFIKIKRKKSLKHGERGRGSKKNEDNGHRKQNPMNATNLAFSLKTEVAASPCGADCLAAVRSGEDVLCQENGKSIQKNKSVIEQ